MKLIHILSLLLVLNLSSLFADNIEVGKTYRTEVILDVYELNGTIKDKVGKFSKFKIVDENDSLYFISFFNVYEYKVLKKVEKSTQQTNTDHYTTQKTSIVPNTLYTIEKYNKKKTINKNNINYQHRIYPSSANGFVSGPLIVPFKYRFDDKSLEIGDITLGTYIGWRWGTPWYIDFTPILSAGITIVNDGSTDEEPNKGEENGFSFAYGLLIDNIGDTAIGLIYGRDWIGDKNWKHEGKGWLSLSFNWKFDTK
jgi:hypothetical protein